MTDLDLTPRDPDADPRARRRFPALRNVLIGLGLVALLSIVLYQALTSARVFFYNVDEAVANRAELGDQTLRMQGTVVTDDGIDATGAMRFTVAFEGEEAEVRHTGAEPSGLFQLGEQVLVEGHWDGEVFQSHQVLVKHSEEYIEDNPGRVDDELDDELDADVS